MLNHDSYIAILQTILLSAKKGQGSFKNVNSKIRLRIIYIYFVCISGIWYWITYSRWYAIKPKQTKAFSSRMWLRVNCFWWFEISLTFPWPVVSRLKSSVSPTFYSLEEYNRWKHVFFQEHLYYVKYNNFIQDLNLVNWFDFQQRYPLHRCNMISMTKLFVTPVSYFMDIWKTRLFGFHGISTFVGYLMHFNTFLKKKSVICKTFCLAWVHRILKTFLFQAIQFSREVVS